MSRPTIKDVAAAAGVSAQAVSLVINNRPGVSEATRVRVQEIIGRLGYTPHTWAQAMRGSSTRTLGLMYPLSNQGRLSASGYLEEILAGAVATANRKGYHVLLTPLTGDDAAKQVRALEHQRRIDGLIQVISELGPDPAALTGLRLPVVEVQRYSTSHPTVCADDRSGTRMAVAHLLSRGCRRVAYVGQEPKTYSSQERLAGYLEGLSAHGLAVDETLIRYTSSGSSEQVSAQWREVAAEDTSVVDEVLALLHLSEPPEALVCFNDLIALNALRAARIVSRRVPEEFAVVGFGNLNLVAFSDPPLTTVAYPTYELGAKATARLIALVEGEGGEPQMTLPVRLVVRSSG